MIIFLLRNNFITQLHKFLFLMPPDTTSERFNRPLSDADLNFLSNRIKTQIRQFKPVDDVIRSALLRISVDAIGAGMSEADFFWFLSTFISLYPFLNGGYHVSSFNLHTGCLDRSRTQQTLIWIALIKEIVKNIHRSVAKCSRHFSQQEF